MKDMRSASAEESTRLSQRSLGRVLIERTAKVFECELRVREADGGIKPGVSTSEPGNAPQLIRWSPRGGRQPFIKSGVDTRDSFEIMGDSCIATTSRAKNSTTRRLLFDMNLFNS